MIGDAICSFDPIYGQGMTVAAQQATALGHQLDHARSIDRSFARSYFTAASKIVGVPWSIAVGGDFAYAGTTGRKPLGTDLVNRYMARAIQAGQHDDLVVIRLNETMSLLRHPAALMTPAFALRVLRGARRPLRAPTAVQTRDASRGVPVSPRNPRRPLRSSASRRIGTAHNTLVSGGASGSAESRNSE